MRLLCALVLAPLVACSGGGSGGADPATTLPPTPATIEFLDRGSPWRSVDEQASWWFYFDISGAVDAYDGCNWISARFEVDESGRIEIFGGAGTMRECGAPAGGLEADPSPGTEFPGVRAMVARQVDANTLELVADDKSWRLEPCNEDCER